MEHGHLFGAGKALVVPSGDADMFRALHLRSEHVFIRGYYQLVPLIGKDHPVFDPHGVEQGAFEGNAGKLQRLQPPVVVGMAGERHGGSFRLHAVNHVVQLLHPEVPDLRVALPGGGGFQHLPLRIQQRRAVLEVADVAAAQLQHELDTRGVFKGDQPHHAFRAPGTGDQLRSGPAPEAAEGSDQEVHQAGGPARYGVQVRAAGKPRA